MFNLWGHEGVKAQLPSCWGVPTPAGLKFSHNKGTNRPLLVQHCWLLMARQPRLPDWAWQNCCWKGIIHFLSLLSKFIWSREPKLRHPEGKNRWVPSLAAELAARGNAWSGSFCNEHEVGTGVFSSLLLKLPFLSIFQARRGYLSWQPWKSSTIWCLYVCRGSTEGFSVTDEICSPSNTPAKEILPLESQPIRFLLRDVWYQETECCEEIKVSTVFSHCSQYSCKIAAFPVLHSNAVVRPAAVSFSPLFFWSSWYTAIGKHSHK